MKKVLLLPLFLHAAFLTYACSCFYISDYFCPTVGTVTSKYNTELYIAAVKIESKGGNFQQYMEVAVVENLYRELPEESLTVLGQDGLNCNEPLFHFELGKTYILALNASFFEPDNEVYDLNGCGRFWLPLEGDMVNGKINENTSSQSLQAFTANLTACLATTDTEDPELQQLQLFPNPSTKTTFLSGLKPGYDYRYQLLSASGQLVQKGRFSGSAVNEISVAQLPRGLYLLRVQSGQAIISRRLVVQ